MLCAIKRLRKRAFSSSSRRTSTAEAAELDSFRSTEFILSFIRIFLDGDTKMIARCREASLGFSDTALSVREDWGWDWSLASRNWPDIVWPIAKVRECP